MYIDDCIKGSFEIVESETRDPINLGTSGIVTINKLVDILESIGGVSLQKYIIY
jgi:hypothetical protein